ncbi:PAS domain-containing protein [Hirschia litorea]|uniref:PAS domain-containing protein n=2 Tax=Hirschia litorea TaxID=1199156 RepID=A0ABW2III1_9PROT
MTLLNEWIANKQLDRIASRDEMQPAQFITELAYISILEKVETDIIFRISGSEIRRMLGREARGRKLVQFPGLARSNAGMQAAKSAFKHAQPVSGTYELPGNRVHFWLRLPIVDKRGKLTQLLCHDRVLDHEMIEVEAPSYVIGQKVQHAA